MEKIINELTNFLNARTTFLILLASLSGMVNYFYKMSKGEHWNLKMFFINNSMAIFIGYSVSLILPDTEWEKVVVMGAAFIARDLLGLLEIYGSKYVESRIKKELNLNNNKKNKG